MDAKTYRKAKNDELTCERCACSRQPRSSARRLRCHETRFDVAVGKNHTCDRAGEAKR